MKTELPFPQPANLALRSRYSIRFYDWAKMFVKAGGRKFPPIHAGPDGFAPKLSRRKLRILMQPLTATTDGRVPLFVRKADAAKREASPVFLFYITSIV